MSVIDLRSEAEDLDPFSDFDTERRVFHLTGRLRSRYVDPEVFNTEGGDSIVNEYQRKPMDDITLIESRILEYMSEWGDSEDLRLILYIAEAELSAIALNGVTEDGFHLVSELWETRELPALLLATGAVTNELFIRKNPNTRPLTKGDAVFTVWVDSVRSACEQLDFTGISHAPAEVFEGLLRPYVEEQFARVVAQR